MTSPNGFDAEFASPAEWARFYRSLEIQVVPAFMPGEPKGGAWKRPLLRDWRQYQDHLVTDAVFDPWYGPFGEFRQRPNMGVICGRASHNLMVIDLDIHKNDMARRWWLGLLAIHNNDMELETVEQRTGGGGLQKLYLCPQGWTPPTCKTSIGVDIRGQGGFAMLAPSRHESGQAYEWLEGHGPDDLDITMAPGWLLEAVTALVVAHGGQTGQERPDAAKAGHSAFDGFGHQTDGREQKMTELVWGAVVDWRRDWARPGMPDDAQVRQRCAEKYLVYEGLVSARASHPPGMSKTDQIEAEGRGTSLFWRKWIYAMRQWDTDVAEEAAKPQPNSHTGQAGGGPGFTDFTDEYAASGAKPKVDPATGQPLPLILTAEEFLRGFRPPDYLVDGMIQRSYLVSLTARTGHGKTAIAMLLGTCIARGTTFHGKPTERGGVLFLAGENPDDIRARYLALASHEGFDPYGIPFHFVDGVINIQTELSRIRDEAAKIQNLSLIIVDTQAAYFLGDEGNSNEQQGWFARLLRELIKLPGRPTVLVNCHPVKNATRDNLIPMGGSAFLNEVDCNLTLWADDKVCVLGPHQDKWRGVTFEELPFELRQILCSALKDTKDREMPSVIAVPISEEGAASRDAVANEDDKVVLRLFHADKNSSFAMIAKRSGFTKSKVQRTVRRLYESKFVYLWSKQQYRITKKGCKRVGLKFEAENEDE